MPLLRCVVFTGDTLSSKSVNVGRNEPLPQHEPLYEGSMDLHRRIVALYPKVAGKNAFFRDLHLISPWSPRPRIGGPRGVDTDRVFCALAIRVAATKESIVLLCEAGCFAFWLWLRRGTSFSVVWAS
jgi:hypothetical protein